MLIRAIIIFAALLNSSAYARSPHGLNTTWNSSLLGASWVCFNSLVAGCSQAFNATCNGVADDTSALTSFRSYAASQSASTLVGLYIAPGSNCNITYDGSFSFTSGAKTLAVWTYNVTFNPGLSIGGLQAFFHDSTHQALIADANIGDTTVTVTDGNIARFTVGHWIAVTGLSLQASLTYPPNFAFYEYRKITAINGNVVSLDSSLVNNYKSTWPSVSSGPPNGGPATIFDLDQTWDTTVQWYGGTVTGISPGQQVTMLGRDITINNIILLGTMAADPTASKSFVCNNCIFNGGMEIDKDLENATFNNVSTGQVTVASMNRSITFNNVSFINGGSLNGTGLNMTINRSNLTTSSFNSLGPSFGAASTLTLTNSNLGSFQCTTSAVQTGWFTYSSGTFTIANNAAHWADALAWGVVGGSYFYGTVAPIVNLGSSFTITGIRQDATNTYFDTNLGSNPSLGQTHYIAQPAPTVNATNMTGSSTPNNASGAWCHL